jgi:hypothetical protein
MPTFRAGGREWLLKLDAPKIREVRQQFDGLDLADTDRSMSAYDRCAADPVLLVDVLYVLCRQAVQDAGLTDRQFGEALVGPAIADATTALVEAYADFSPARAPAIRARQKQIAELMSRAETTDSQFLTPERMEQIIQTGREENERRFRQWIASHSATSGQANAESPPTA